MKVFKIEMGQGILMLPEQGYDVAVITSTLHSCTFIAGYNSENHNQCGAYHYPSGLGPNKDKRHKEFTQLANWMWGVQPNYIKIIFASADPDGMKVETSDEDKDWLREWMKECGDKFKIKKVEEGEARQAAMTCAQKGSDFHAGNKETEKFNIDDDKAIDLTGILGPTYHKFDQDNNYGVKLFGWNRNIYNENGVLEM